MQAGFDPDAFWRQTPRLFQFIILGRAEERDFQRKRDLAQAHLIAVLTRMDGKKFPTLAKLLGNETPKSIMSTDEIKGAFAAMRGQG